jgi:hypothetical protein
MKALSRRVLVGRRRSSEGDRHTFCQEDDAEEEEEKDARAVNTFFSLRVASSRLEMQFCLLIVATFPPTLSQ